MIEIRPSYRKLKSLDSNSSPGQRQLVSPIRGKKRGFAYQYAIQIANLASKDIGINITASADNGYVTRPVRLPHVTLEPNHKIYIEHRNQAWNSLFEQCNNNQLAAEIEVRAGGSNLANHGLDHKAEWGRRRHVRQLIEHAMVFQDVCGEGSINRDNRFPLGGERHIHLELCSSCSRGGCWGQTEETLDLNACKLLAIEEPASYPSRLNPARRRPWPEFSAELYGEIPHCASITQHL